MTEGGRVEFTLDELIAIIEDTRSSTRTDHHDCPRRRPVSRVGDPGRDRRHRAVGLVVVSTRWVGLLGVVPVAIGIRASYGMMSLR